MHRISSSYTNLKYDVSLEEIDDHRIILRNKFRAFGPKGH